MPPADRGRLPAGKEHCMKRSQVSALALAVTMTLAGCAVSPAEDSSGTVQFTALQQSSGWNYGGGGPEGFYSVSAQCREDGSTNLLYLDYATMQQIPLCSQPNCSHDTDACTSYLPYSAGGILCSVVGEQLVLVFPGNLCLGDTGTDTVLPHIETMGLDGSDRKTTVTLGANQEISRPLVTDGQFLYTRLNTTTQDGNTTAQLVRMDPAGGEPEALCDLNQEWLRGGAGSRLILWDADQTYTAYGPATGERAVLYQAEDALIYSNLFDSTLAYLQDGVFHLKDLTTGEDTTLGGYRVSEEEKTGLSILDADEEHLIFRLETADSSTCFMLTGDQAPQPWNLVYTASDMTMPYERVTAVGDDQYLVVTGQTAPQGSDLQANPYAVTGAPQYRLMSQADYWNSTAPK